MKLFVWTIGDGECSYIHAAFADNEEEAREMLLNESYQNELKRKKEILIRTDIKHRDLFFENVGEDARFERSAFREIADIYEIKKSTLHL